MTVIGTSAIEKPSHAVFIHIISTKNLFVNTPLTNDLLADILLTMEIIEERAKKKGERVATQSGSPNKAGGVLAATLGFTPGCEGFNPPALQRFYIIFWGGLQ